MYGSSAVAGDQLFRRAKRHSLLRYNSQILIIFISFSCPIFFIFIRFYLSNLFSYFLLFFIFVYTISQASCVLHYLITDHCCCRTLHRSVKYVRTGEVRLSKRAFSQLASENNSGLPPEDSQAAGERTSGRVCTSNREVRERNRVLCNVIALRAPGYLPLTSRRAQILKSVDRTATEFRRNRGFSRRFNFTLI